MADRMGIEITELDDGTFTVPCGYCSASGSAPDPWNQEHPSEVCGVCSGAGANLFSADLKGRITRCAKCAGDGVEHNADTSEVGPCPACEGRGVLTLNPPIG